MSATGKKLFFIGTSALALGALTLGGLWFFSPQTLQKVLGPELFGKLRQATDTPANAAVKADDFHLLDQEGRSHYLHRQATSKAVVLISTVNGSANLRKAVPTLKKLRDRLSGQPVTFWMINANPADDRASLLREAKDLGLDMPILQDSAQLVVRALGLEKVGEVVGINPTNWTVFYHGAIDDRFAGEPKPAKGNYLENALDNFLAGKKISPSRTTVSGLAISLTGGKDLSRKPISYANTVAPVLQQSCVPCHSPGNIGPFAMSSYEKVKGWSSMIQEVLLTQRMPPWHADPHYGAFANERALSPEQAQTLVAWIQQGASRGLGQDPLATTPAPPAEDWPMGKPDYIVKFPKAEEIPANGVFKYRYILANSPIPSNAWLRAAVVKPGNRKVVHHVLVLIKTADELRTRQRGSPGGGGIDGYFAAYVPGYQAVPYPEGTGKFLPKGTVLLFQMHYTETGKPETDLTELGLYLAKEKPEIELKTRSAFNVQFQIPPGDADHETVAEYQFGKDALLYDLSPHMHLRGSRFQYEAVYPDGKREVLLSVPNYDFKWQHLYRFTEPKRLPAGTKLVCRGAHDNSAQNPSNPDAQKTVGFGEQTFDEMFIGYLNYSDLPASKKTAHGGG